MSKLLDEIKKTIETIESVVLVNYETTKNNENIQLGAFLEKEVKDPAKLSKKELAHEKELETFILEYFHNEPNTQLTRVEKEKTCLRKINGRKVCKVGYPFSESITETKKYAFLHLLYSEEGKEYHFVVPVDVSVTKKNNLCEISAELTWNNDLPTLTVQSGDCKVDAFIKYNYGFTEKSYIAKEVLTVNGKPLE